MKANIKPELKESAPSGEKELKRWGPLTPGQWTAVAFVLFALSILNGDKSSVLHRVKDAVVGVEQGEVVNQGEGVDLQQGQVVDAQGGGVVGG